MEKHRKAYSTEYIGHIEISNTGWLVWWAPFTSFLDIWKFRMKVIAFCRRKTLHILGKSCRFQGRFLKYCTGADFQVVNCLPGRTSTATTLPQNLSATNSSPSKLNHWASFSSAFWSTRVPLKYIISCCKWNTLIVADVTEQVCPFQCSELKECLYIRHLLRFSCVITRFSCVITRFSCVITRVAEPEVKYQTPTLIRFLASKMFLPSQTFQLPTSTP